jgi:CheY-like chemotaxis protein
MSSLELTYVIEDDPITATTTKILLEKNWRGERVQTYGNGELALKQLVTALTQGVDVPDLILLDLNMPMMDGWEFLEAFSRLSLPHPICVLVLTSSINPADHVKAARYQNVAGYFSKPLNASSILKLRHLRREAQGPGRQLPAQPDAGLHHLVYQSQATTPLTEVDLARLLIQSRAFNAANGLTGVLLYSEGNIMQLLEGSAATISAVFDRIARDPRHTQVIKLADGPISQRLFAQWSMGFQLVQPLAFGHLTGYATSAQVQDLATPLVLPDPDLHALIATFIEVP